MRNEEVIAYTVDTVKEEKMIVDAKIRLVGREVPSVQINNRKSFCEFCVDLFGNSACEEFHVICVNTQCQVITESMISSGDLSSVNAYPSKIAQIALLSNAHAVLLAHNHPGGTFRPSVEDIQGTQAIKKALKLFNIGVLDHMIITPNGEGYSMLQHGDIEFS